MKSNHRQEKSKEAIKLRGSNNIDTANVRHYLSSDSFNLALLTRSWEEIGVLTSEIASTVMAKQASILYHQFAEENTPIRPLKKRRTEKVATTQEIVTSLESVSPKAPSIVTTGGSDEEGEGTLPTSNSHNDESDGLEHDQYRQIDRLGRMSKLIIHLENCHSQLRAEMLFMAEDNDLEVGFHLSKN
jgi:hypothetical protein